MQKREGLQKERRNPAGLQQACSGNKYVVGAQQERSKNDREAQQECGRAVAGMQQARSRNDRGRSRSSEGNHQEVGRAEAGM